ncbi:MAG: hypothetical protein SFV24_08635, partial [Gemmatimonadales bacterium]|nr:hypothetical protein [Gemmatimonadales bacterium]
MKTQTTSGLFRTLMLGAAVATTACNNLLDVSFPGQIPSEQASDPNLAAVLARSVIGDFECAYSNYMSGSSVHSDEYETSNSNVPLANWGERTITKDETDYVIGTCEGNFGMHLTLHTARFQSEDIFKKLQGWTDAQVPGRSNLMAQVRVYGAYSYLLMGEGFCRVSFDGGPEEAPTAALAKAEAQFAEAITLANSSGNTDMANLARVGMARVKMDLKKWSEAVTFADQVTAGYNKNADRGQETARRWNKLYRLAEQNGAYTVATAYRNLTDPRPKVIDAGRGAFNSEVRLWVTRKYSGLTSPMRLASKIEANLIKAEALIQQDQIAAGMAILNARRAETDVNLPPLSASTKQDALNHLLSERRMELSFEGGH